MGDPSARGAAAGGRSCRLHSRARPRRELARSTRPVGLKNRSWRVATSGGTIEPVLPRPVVGGLALAALLLACSGIATPPLDAGVDAAPALDASVDAAPVCSELDQVGESHDHCLGCGQPCPASQPFCCLATCCAEECGQAVNDCSPSPDPTRPTDFGDRDDGCQDPGWSARNCFDCGIGCRPARPFCCGFMCCAEECGGVDNDCSDEP